MSQHLAAIYYQPSWLGGDEYRPLCKRQHAYSSDHALLTHDANQVTCCACISRMQGRTVRRLAEKVLAPPAAPQPPQPYGPPGPTPRQIIAGVAARRGLTVEILTDPASPRIRAIAHARQEAMWEMRQRTGLSLVQIAQRVGRSDHATALHGVREHEKRRAEQGVIQCS